MKTLSALVVKGGIQTGPFGTQLHASDYTEQGIGVVMPQDLGDNVVVEGSMARVAPTTARSLERHKLLPGDIVFSRRGDVTRRALIRDGDGDLLCGTGCLRVRLDRDVADPEFVSYALAVKETRDWLVRHAVGATMANLNTRILSAVPLRAPELKVQRVIASVLGALDDKISANAHLILMLWQIVDARARLAVLNNSLTVRLGDIARLNYGRALSVADRRGGEVVVMGSGGAVGKHDKTLVPGPSVILGRKGSVGATYWVDGPAYPIDTTYWVESEAAPLSFVYTVLKNIDFSGMSTDSAVPGLNRDRAYAIPVALPSPEDLQAFELSTAPLVERAAAARDENGRLAATRDELLPLLMSGKITVKDAEKTVEGVI